MRANLQVSAVVDIACLRPCGEGGYCVNLAGTAGCRLQRGRMGIHFLWIVCVGRWNIHGRHFKAQDQDHLHQFSPSSQSKRHFQAPTASPRPIPPEPTSCHAMPCTASLSMLPSAYMLGSACYATCHPTCIPLGPETTSFPWEPPSQKSNSPTRTQHHEHHQTALISHAV